MHIIIGLEECNLKDISLLKQINKFLNNKKAENIVILDIHLISTISNYFMIASAITVRQVKAITREITEKLSKKGIHPEDVEGLSEGKWVLLDYGNVIIHIFTREERNYYKLDHVWNQARKVDLSKIEN